VETPTRSTRSPFRGSTAVRAGLITWDRLLGPDFRRLRPDVYVGAATEVDTRVRVEALSVWSRGRGVVAGPLAALAFGAECPWEDAEIVIPQHCRVPPAEVTVRTGALGDGEIATRFGCRITSPLRTAFDLARREPLVEAVAAVDSLAHVSRFTAERLRSVAADHPRARGIVVVRRVIELMDGRAESLPETRLRIGLLHRDVPPGVPQFPVTLLNGYGARLDLAWPHRRLALEFNGPDHRTITGQNRDAFRTGRLDDIGWDILPVTSAMVLDPVALDELAGRVLRKLA
jgi:hypothetical protein